MYTRKTAWVIGGWIVLAFLDVMTTYMILESGGQEINPVSANLMDQFGQNVALFGIFPGIKILMGLIVLSCVAITEKKCGENNWMTQSFYWISLLAVPIIAAPFFWNLVQIYGILGFF